MSLTEFKANQRTKFDLRRKVAVPCTVDRQFENLWRLTVGAQEFHARTEEICRWLRGQDLRFGVTMPMLENAIFECWMVTWDEVMSEV